MGTFHNQDGNLRSFSEKTIKFKQKVLLVIAHSQNAITKEHYEIVKDGQCTAFSMMWIAQQYELGNHFHRAQGVKTAEDQFSLETTKNATASAVQYRSPPPGSLFEKETKALADTWGLKTVGDLQDSGQDNITNWFKKWTYDAPTNDSCEAAYMVCSLNDRDGKMKDGRHALGLFCDEAGVVHFFDSNVGAYKLNMEMYQGFFDEYAKILKNSFNTVYRQLWAYGVTKK